jgi:hypothetical protein
MREVVDYVSNEREIGSQSGTRTSALHWDSNSILAVLRPMVYK